MLSEAIFTENWKPARPLVTNDFKDGLYRKNHAEGLDFRWVETTPVRFKNMIVLDLDDEESESKIKTLAYDDESIPEPNWMTFNPNSGHAHIGWVLSSGIGTQKGQEYLRDVRARLNVLIGGDAAYKGFTTRNPLQHPTSWMSDRLYTLKELDAYTVKVGKVEVEKAQEEAQGRNDLLFASLRKFAYAAYRRSGFNDDALLSLLSEKALELYFSEIADHQGFPPSEVNAIVRSVHKWTVKNHSKAAFSEIQRKRQQKRWGTHTQDNDPFIIMLKEEMGFSFQEMADNLGMSAAGAKTAYYRAKRRTV